jgi:hypothetical protein
MSMKKKPLLRAILHVCLWIVAKLCSYDSDPFDLIMVDTFLLMGRLLLKKLITIDDFLPKIESYNGIQIRFRDSLQIQIDKCNITKSRYYMLKLGSFRLKIELREINTRE